MLSDDSVAEQLKTASAEDLRALLMGEKQPAAFSFDTSLITLDVNARDLMTLQALNAGRLQAAGVVDASYVADVVSRHPLSLGQGIWLSDSGKGNSAKRRSRQPRSERV